jgi:hypothetical protein
MKRTVIDCDVCKNECEPHIHIDIPNGVTHSYGLPSSETYYEYEHKDLCASCAEALFKFIFGHKRVTIIPQCVGDHVSEIKIEWQHNRYSHASASSNDAVKLALDFFKIKPRE